MIFSIINPDVAITRNEETFLFTFKYYLKGNNRLTGKIFDPINRYLSTLPDQKLDAIFAIYKRIHTIFYKDDFEIRYSEENIQDVIIILQTTIKELYEEIDFADLETWCAEKGEFYYQSNLKDDAGTYKPETTYLKEHYRGLLFLSTLLKFIAPVWGVFITEFDKSLGKDYKETVALTLLSHTDILERMEFLKLQSFVDAMSDRTINTINAIFGNLGTIDLSDWALATVTVRKVAVAEVDNEEVKLINIIFSHLTNLNKKNSLEDRGDSIRIKERRSPEEDSGDDENRASVLEKYKLRQVHPDHVSIIDEVYLYNIKKVLRDIDRNFPTSREPYKSYIRQFNRLNFSRLNITEFHIKICAAVCRHVISPRNLENIQYLSFLRLIFISQLLLHFWGFPILANMLTAEVEETTHDVLRDNSFISLPIDIQEKLSELYPYFKAGNKTTAFNRKPLIVNVGTIFVGEMMEYINRNNWFYINDKLSETKGTTGTMISVPVDMKIQIANFLLKSMNIPKVNMQMLIKELEDEYATRYR